MVTRFNMETARAVLYRKAVVQGCNLPRATKQPSIFQKTSISTSNIGAKLKEDLNRSFDHASRLDNSFPAIKFPPNNFENRIAGSNVYPGRGSEFSNNVTSPKSETEEESIYIHGTFYLCYY